MRYIPTIFILLFTTIIKSCWSPNYPDRIAFEPQLWEEVASMEYDSLEAKDMWWYDNDMAEDLVSKNVLINKTFSEVKSLLGSGHMPYGEDHYFLTNSDSNIVIYPLGRALRGDPLDNDWLIIFFNKDTIVESCEFINA